MREERGEARKGGEGRDREKRRDWRGGTETGEEGGGEERERGEERIGEEKARC